MYVFFPSFSGLIFNPPTGNQSRKSLREWVLPPDSSTNHNIACDLHYGETAQWFFQGSIFGEWKLTGSLLWVYGKRMFYQFFTDRPSSPFTFSAGSGKTILWLVVTHYSTHRWAQFTLIVPQSYKTSSL